MQLTAAEARTLCVKLVDRAAALVAAERAERLERGELLPAATKSSAVDPVTEVDTRCEHFIISELASRRPDDAILGEEGARTSGTTGVEWIIDPIDGTVNFLYGIPAYAVSIGAAVDGVLVAGAVCNVATGEVFSAAVGEGATLRHRGVTRRLEVSGVRSLERSLVATGFSYTAAWRARQAEILCGVLPRARDIRRSGSAALDLCNVAAGRVDAYYEHGTHPWDYAAGAVIASEAGARVEHPGVRASGSDGGITVAAAPGIWEQLRKTLESAGALAPLKGI